MDDFVPARASFLATLEAGLALTFLDSFGGACFFTDFDMVMFRVLESKIGSPTTQCPQFAGHRLFAV